MSNGLAIAGLSRVVDKIAAGEKFSVANSRRGYITAAGIRDMLRELREAGNVPYAVVLSKRDRRDLNDDLMGMSTTPVADADANNSQMQIAIIEGVMVGWNRNVENGKCIVIPKQPGT